jgi:hypothetical protein
MGQNCKLRREDKMSITVKPEITDRQRSAQASKLSNAIELLQLAMAETKTATANEISQTVDVALEVIIGVNKFLKSRQ